MKQIVSLQFGFIFYKRMIRLELSGGGQVYFLGIDCGQCTLVCPTGALVEHQDWKRVLRELDSKRKKLIVQVHVINLDCPSKSCCYRRRIWA
jgi:hypothetical protein